VRARAEKETMMNARMKRPSTDTSADLPSLEKPPIGRIGLLGAALVLAAAASLFAAGEARLLATVVDEEGNPVEGVTATLRSSAAGFEMTETTDRRGRFTMLILDAIHPPYTLTLQKEGYHEVSGEVGLRPGGVNRPEFVLPKPPPPPDAPQEKPLEGSGEAIELFNAGAALYNAGDAAGAIAEFEEALAIDDDFVAALRLLAGLHLDGGRPEPALELAGRWLELEPASAEAALLRYDALVALGRHEEATALLPGLMETAAGGELALRLFNLGADTQRKGDEEAAIAWMEKAVAADPEFTQAWSALASLRFTEGRHQAAIEAAGKVLAVHPGDVEALTVQYEAYKALGDKARADELLAQMQATSSDPQVLYRQGVAMFNASNVEGAIATLRQALEQDPDLAGAHYTLGLALLGQGQNADAQRHLERFLALSPDHPDAETARQMLQHLGSG
jgi:tetratricopeptide (TPR) repeat protein